ncbi:transposase [Bacillus pseudomycoides]|uniref:tyrosine-type recombinase/integrase n=1 Tax=Bacillus pseudomycoides TaxID=64104 RepID=UPI000BF74DFB|nr:tyrosine-type recombinase/integrase [Bacillus pseudomycoides]PGF05949.1 transposase [Bacillus pseudomycoides]
MIKVQSIITSSGEERWIVLNKNGDPIIPIMKFIKYKDALGKAPNTLKTYCYHLKLFWGFLNEKNKDYTEADLSLLTEFINWLRNPSDDTNTIYLTSKTRDLKVAKRTESSINSINNCVIEFFDYQWRSGQIFFDIKSKVTKEVKNTRRRYRKFLDHVTHSQTKKINILKLNEPRRKIKTITNKQAKLIHVSCNNIRDELIIRILYEGGLRASELLSLWIEDFNINDGSITVRESKTKAGEKRKIYVSKETMNLFQDYIIDYHTDDVDSNYVFINLRGKNKGKPMQYWALQAAMRILSKKTKIDFTAHMLRHTYATNLYDLGLDVGIIQKLLGHAQVQTTLNMYIHPSEETIRKHWDEAQQHRRMRE